MTKTEILIVEDDPLVAVSLVDCLTMLGHSVSAVAASGEEALRRAEESRPDLALLDIKLHGEMDGVAAAKEMRARFDIPVVYLTGYYDDAVVERAAGTEPHGFLTKPYDPGDLKRTIEIAVHKHAMERRLRESEARYRALVESSVQGLVVVEGKPLRILLANPTCAAITGYSVDELLCLSSEQLKTLIHPSDQASVLDSLENHLAGRAIPVRGELRMVNRDGEVRWIEYFGSLVEHEGRSAVQASFVDITERQHAENALRRAYDELEQRVEERTDELVQANERLREEMAARLESEQTLERRTRELQMLHHSAQELSSSLDLDYVVTTVLAEVRHLLDASGCTVWLVDQQEGHLTCWQAAGPHRLMLTGMHVPLGEGLVGWVAQQHESLLVPDTRADDRHFKQVDQSVGIETRCILSVPLKVKEKLIGVIQVVGEQPACFDQSDLTLLEPLATSAAIAIENARLYDEANALRAFNEGIVQSMQEGIILENDAGEIIFANPATADLLGYEVEELKGRNRWHLVAPAYREQQVQSEAGDRTSGSGSRYESVFLTKSGGRLPVIVSARPILEGGWLNGTLVVFVDISERKRAEIALRNRQRELILLNRVIAASAESVAIDSILDVVCRELARAFDIPHALAVLLNADGTRATVVAHHHANGRNRALGRNVAIAHDPAIRHLVEKRVPLARTEPDGGAVPSPKHSLLHLADAVSTLAIPLALDGEIVGGLGMSATEARPFSAKEIELAQRVAEQISGALARAQLTETQQRLSTAIEQAGEAVLITETDGTILYVNPAFEQMTGYSRAEAIGRNPRILKSGRQEADFYEKLWSDLTTGQKWQGRLVNRKKDDTPYIADETIAPVHDQDGEIVSYVATMRDVTREVGLEEQVHHAQKMEALGRLAGSIAHDFGNLLMVVETGAAIVLMQLPPQVPLREQVEQIRRTGERGRALTQQLLRFSRREIAEPLKLVLNRVVEDMAWMLERLLGSDIEIVTDLAQDLWPIRVGISGMEQVIMNLVINARDAMPNGGTVSIKTTNVVLDGLESGSGTGEYVQLAVRDTGVGMTDEVKARLFEPFFTTKERGHGTGLGLSTVFAIVEQGGGQIEVESELDHGTIFRISLPRAGDNGTGAVS
jgi:PAS domain S-box-containing protein